MTIGGGLGERLLGFGGGGGGSAGANLLAGIQYAPSTAKFYNLANADDLEALDTTNLTISVDSVPTETVLVRLEGTYNLNTNDPDEGISLIWGLCTHDTTDIVGSLVTVAGLPQASESYIQIPVGYAAISFLITGLVIGSNYQWDWVASISGSHANINNINPLMVMKATTLTDAQDNSGASPALIEVWSVP